MEFETFLQISSQTVLILFGMDFLITLSTNSTDNWQRKSNFLCLTNILECFQNRFALSSSKTWLYYLIIHNKTKNGLFIVTWQHAILFIWENFLIHAIMLQKIFFMNSNFEIEWIWAVVLYNVDEFKNWFLLFFVKSRALSKWVDQIKPSSISVICNFTLKKW